MKQIISFIIIILIFSLLTFALPRKEKEENLIKTENGNKKETTTIITTIMANMIYIISTTIIIIIFQCTKADESTSSLLGNDQLIEKGEYQEKPKTNAINLRYGNIDQETGFVPHFPHEPTVSHAVHSTFQTAYVQPSAPPDDNDNDNNNLNHINNNDNDNNPQFYSPHLTHPQSSYRQIQPAFPPTLQQNYENN
ncbi:hypothetical protein M0811_08039 [Anaeramoeba ignava]|uniref:Uncharacterized protein n=1 Tax=Anaeramoeba ignava TaxID=1746090 RepID=A0A9Q0RDF7_ANAIG|nr:hypothetical protein M0811_08039 [Anaeramoeba ignava]